MRPRASKYLYGKLHFIDLGDKTLQCELQEIKYTSTTSSGVTAMW